MAWCFVINGVSVFYRATASKQKTYFDRKQGKRVRQNSKKKKKKKKKKTFSETVGIAGEIVRHSLGFAMTAVEVAGSNPEHEKQS